MDATPHEALDAHEQHAACHRVYIKMTDSVTNFLSVSLLFDHNEDMQC